MPRVSGPVVAEEHGTFLPGPCMRCASESSGGKCFSCLIRCKRFTCVSGRSHGGSSSKLVELRCLKPGSVPDEQRFLLTEEKTRLESALIWACNRDFDQEPNEKTAVACSRCAGCNFNLLLHWPGITHVFNVLGGSWTRLKRDPVVLPEVVRIEVVSRRLGHMFSDVPSKTLKIVLKHGKKRSGTEHQRGVSFCLHQSCGAVHTSKQRKASLEADWSSSFLPCHRKAEKSSLAEGAEGASPDEARLFVLIKRAVRQTYLSRPLTSFTAAG